jgi:hypothetical protein
MRDPDWHKHSVVGSGRCGSNCIFHNWSSVAWPDWPAWCRCPGSAGRGHTLVCCGRDHLGLAALNCSAASRIDFRPASSRLHAHDGESCTNQFVRNGSGFLRIWRRVDDCGADFVVRNPVCQVRRSGILSDGSPLRHRAPVCLVRLG